MESTKWITIGVIVIMVPFFVYMKVSSPKLHKPMLGIWQEDPIATRAALEKADAQLYEDGALRSFHQVSLYNTRLKITTRSLPKGFMQDKPVDEVLKTIAARQYEKEWEEFLFFNAGIDVLSSTQTPDCTKVRIAGKGNFEINNYEFCMDGQYLVLKSEMFTPIYLKKMAELP